MRGVQFLQQYQLRLMACGKFRKQTFSFCQTDVFVRHRGLLDKGGTKD
jgi:hypothetical protein